MKKLRNDSINQSNRLIQKWENMNDCARAHMSVCESGVCVCVCVCVCMCVVCVIVTVWL